MNTYIYNSVKNYYNTVGLLCNTLDYKAIEGLTKQIFKTWVDKGQVFVFGNGGSACTATHFVADLVKTAAVEGKRHLHAFSLNDNVGLLTAIGNDITYDDIFRYALSCYAKPGDMVIAISCSGNSPNVLQACHWAKENKLLVAAVTGFAGGHLKDLADLHINVPHEDFGIVESLHSSIAHIVTQEFKHLLMTTPEE